MKFGCPKPSKMNCRQEETKVTMFPQVWGTLKLLLEAKSHGIIEKVEPYVLKMSDVGMWISAEIKERILKLAGES
jgi:predicted nucleic acid-binding protein